MTKTPSAHIAADEDFVAHLQARIGLKSEAATMATLADWLASYRPGPAALARATTLPSAHRSAA